ncbi:hypothetical protein O7632_20585 [Solwaraspora sp. WMMD406]|uniref:hypothetical protein n=1 Tax=Solwaraspora sp. WMMD406 TaxID=3016095 RepID=UPI002416ED66|nr:hypothetical protein [Solwaraspora sp. WMMD406]MDG4766479.1 hypothetical protein [Solwaraspora sp. WMMD406]
MRIIRFSTRGKGGAHRAVEPPSSGDRKRRLVIGATAATALVAGATVAPQAYATTDFTGPGVRTQIVDAATGAPVSDICVFAVSVFTFSFANVCPTRSDAAGRVNVTVPGPGSYNLFVLPDSGSPYGAQWVSQTGGTGTQKNARWFTFTADEIKPGPTIRLDPRATISGSVLGADEETLGHATVGIVAPIPDGSRDPRYSLVADDGTFSIDWLGPYQWPLLFKADGYPYQWSGHVGNRLRAELVTTDANGPVPFDYQLERGTEVTVDIPDPPQGPGRIVFHNAATRDPVGVAELGASATQAQLLVLPRQPVKIHCVCSGVHRWHGGTDFASATTEPINANGPQLITFTQPS